MSKPPISFRLTEYEIQLLESNRVADESLSQTAARLLRVQLGTQKDLIDCLQPKTLDGMIDDKVQAFSQDVYKYVDSLVNPIIERLEALEKKPRSRGRSSGANQE